MDGQEIELKTWIPTTSYELAAMQHEAYIDYFERVKSTFSGCYLDRAADGISKSWHQVKLTIDGLVDAPIPTKNRRRSMSMSN